MNQKHIIINADDFGYTTGCNMGIIKALVDGIVTSTTVMMNMPHAVDGIELAVENGIHAMGVHLNLTKGRPLSPADVVPSLVDGSGNFRPLEDIISSGAESEIETELRAQIERFLNTGLELSHIDSHHHVHNREGLSGIFIRLSNEYGVPLRRLNLPQSVDYMKTDSFSAEFHGDHATAETLKRIISQAPFGVTEIMAHPALLDDDLLNLSSYNVQRLRELEILTGDDIKNWIESEGVRLVSYEEAFSINNKELER